MDKNYDEFHRLICRRIRANNACVPGYKELLLANSIGKLCVVIRNRWSDVTNMYRKEAAYLFSKYYDKYKEEFQKQGIFYNCDTDCGLVLIYYAKGITIYGNANASIYGDSEVIGRGNASLYATDESNLILEESASATMDGKATCISKGRNYVNARGNNTLIVAGPATIDAGGNSLVDAYQWVRIRAFGDAEVTASTSRGIQMLGNNKLTIKSRLE